MNELFLIICVNLLLQQVGSEQLVNIALGKTPTQDGILNFPEQGIHPWIVSNSVDGRTDCEVVDERYYSGTAVTDNPWWQLDLGYIYKIHAIHIMGRRETDPDQLAGFRLFAGIADGNLQFVYRNNDTVYNAGDIWINTTMSAKFILIDLPKDDVTHREHGGTLTLCEVEVYVPMGDIIKHSSNATQSSEYSSYGGHFAIDGIYPTSDNKTPEACHCCSATRGTERPWWSVNFGQPQMIAEVIITGRMDYSNAYQSKDVSIFISNRIPNYASGLFGELVWNLTNSTQGYAFPHTFEPPRLFQYMSIARPNHGSPYMTICEVDFITAACTLGRFGDRCSRKCHCSDSLPCSLVTGLCQSPGCMTGWKGHNCECQSDHEGSNCSQTCGRCASGISCNVTDGTCPDGCAPNYDPTDKMCKTCISGYYGSNCSQTCGHCNSGNTTCSVINGTCSDGCASGYTFSDRRCQTACRSGLYGSNCSQTCGRCASGINCSVTDGTCPGECAPNYDTTDKMCKTCNSGYYGSYCSQTCGHCIGGKTTCSVINGTCRDGCAPGYTFSDSRCQTACRSGLYGSNCSQTCGRCASGVSCNVTDGTCPGECAPNYDTTGNMCKTCSSGYYGSNCSQTCGHCNSGKTTCSVINGTCSDGCAPGYTFSDSRCQTECQPGHYGLNCSQRCGNCFEDTHKCNKTDGSCPAGCASGYDHTADNTCNKECQPGHYGPSCSQTCGHCTDDTNTCNIIDGSCPFGCAAGYNHTADRKCNTENSPLDKCRPGQYGQNCEGTCGHCIDGNTTCSITDGSCLAGCASGYDYVKDMSCKTECQHGFYGLNCSETCGHCKHGATTCSVIDGTCPSGCKPGYNPADTTCKTGVNILQAPGFSVNTSQSSQHLGSDARRAIDGLKGPDPETCNCCSQTQNAEVSWWQVDMGVVLPIGEIVLYGQNDNRYQQLSLSGFSVYLSTSVSFPDVPFVKAHDDVANATYHIDVQGNFARYVRIQRIGVLIICEVEIFLSDKTCPLSTYTVYCIPCGHCYAGLPCDDITGRCPNGCETGYSGDTCNQAINTGTSYGTKDVIGAGIGGTIGGAIFILLIVMLVLRRKKLRCPWVCQTSQDYESPKPRENTDDQNMYDVLDIPDLFDQSVSGINPATPHYQNTNI